VDVFLRLSNDGAGTLMGELVQPARIKSNCAVSNGARAKRPREGGTTMYKWRERIVGIMLILAVVMAAVIIVASADFLIFGGPAYRPEKVQFTRTTIENTGNNITSVKLRNPIKQGSSVP
jgi:hypothetical protein